MTIRVGRASSGVVSLARLATSGFEWRVPTNGGLADGASAGSGTWAADTTNQRSGAAAISITLTSAALSQKNFALASPFVPLGTTAYQRVYWRKSGNPGTNRRTICAFSGGGGTQTYAFALNTDGTVSFGYFDTGSVFNVLGTSAALSDNTYYRLEIQQLVAVGGTSWTGEGRIDGAAIFSEAAVTRDVSTPAVSTTTQATLGAIDTNAHTGTVTYIYDDFAFNDSTGANQNTWPGSGKVVLLRPITDNARGANWVGGAGGTTSLFDALDNTPPVGVALASATNTSQIKNVTKDTTGNYDANLTTYTTAGLVATDTVNVVHPHWNIGASGTGISHAMLLVSNPAANAGVESTFSPTNIAGTFPTNWSWQVPAVQVVYAPSVTLGTSPVIRLGKRTSSTTAAMGDAMGVYVDYTPATPTTPPRTATVVLQAVNRAANW